DGTRHGPGGRHRDGPLHPAAAEDGEMAGVIARRARRQSVFRWVVVVVLGVFFVLPLSAMVEFSTRDRTTWPTLLDWPKLSATYPDLTEGILNSLGQAGLT